jgi:phosphatidylserine/phosphatidylglycerophosphate/cardiolipin synthase-like enzyme
LLAARSLIALALRRFIEPAFHCFTAHSAGTRLLLPAIEQIYEYQPALMHAKTIVIDGMLATVGSTNFDNRSSL